MAKRKPMQKATIMNEIDELKRFIQSNEDKLYNHSYKLPYRAQLIIAKNIDRDKLRLKELEQLIGSS